MGEEVEGVDAWKAKVTGSGSYSKVEYLQIADGETVDVRVLNVRPKEVYQTRIEVEGKRHPVSVEKADNEEVKKAGHKIQKINAVNVIDRRDGTVKLWEFSEEKKGNIHAIIKRWKKRADQFDIAITRTGLKLKTRYSIGITPNSDPLTKAEQALEKTDLDEYYKPNPERLASLLAGKTPESKQDTAESTETTKETATATKTTTPTDGEEAINPLAEGDDDDVA